MPMPVELRKLETDHAQVDWEKLKNEVGDSIDALRLCWMATQRRCDDALHRKIVAEMYFPILRLLAEFCAAIEVTEEELEERSTQPGSPD